MFYLLDLIPVLNFMERIMLFEWIITCINPDASYRVKRKSGVRDCAIITLHHHSFLLLNIIIRINPTI